MDEGEITSIVLSVNKVDSEGTEVESSHIHIGRNVIDISLLSVSIPNTEYNVDEDESDTIRFIRGGKTFTVTIPPGQYDLKSLPTTLEELMNETDPDVRYTVRYSSISKRITVSSTSLFHFAWGDIDGGGDACDLLGMDCDDKEDSKRHVGIRSPQIWGHLNIQVSLGFKNDEEWITSRFPVTLDPEKDITVRTYQGYTRSALCTFPKKMKVYLSDSYDDVLENTDGWSAVFLMNISGKDTDYEEETEKEEEKDRDKDSSKEKKKSDALPKKGEDTHPKEKERGGENSDTSLRKRIKQ